MTSSTPIPGTIIPVPKMPAKLCIFRTNNSKYWWCRLFLNGRYKFRSTKTTIKKEAFSFAKEFFNQAIVEDLKSGSKFNKKSFTAIAHQMLDTQLPSVKKSLDANDRSRINCRIAPYFKEMEISSITTADLSGFIQSLNNANLQTATKKNYLSLVHKIFIYANEQQLIKSIPVFPRLKQSVKTKQFRDYLEVQEYKKLNRTIIKESKQNKKIKGLLITIEMKLLVCFMINSFIRPSDIRALKHQHISRQYDKNTDTHWLILNHPATKTNAQPVHTMPRAVLYYDQLLDFRASQNTPPNPSDYVFYPQYPNRNTMMTNLGKAFHHIVTQSNLKQTTGKNITLYSLRHTAIMYRLIKGDIDTLHLAKNCRTSQQMIETFYASKITTAQIRRKLHSFTKK